MSEDEDDSEEKTLHLEQWVIKATTDDHKALAERLSTFANTMFVIGLQETANHVPATVREFIDILTLTPSQTSFGRTAFLKELNDPETLFALCLFATDPKVRPITRATNKHRTFVYYLPYMKAIDLYTEMCFSALLESDVITVSHASEMLEKSFSANKIFISYLKFLHKYLADFYFSMANCIHRRLLEYNIPMNYFEEEYVLPFKKKESIVNWSKRLFQLREGRVFVTDMKPYYEIVAHIGKGKKDWPDAEQWMAIGALMWNGMATTFEKMEKKLLDLPTMEAAKIQPTDDVITFPQDFEAGRDSLAKGFVRMIENHSFPPCYYYLHPQFDDEGRPYEGTDPEEDAGAKELFVDFLECVDSAYLLDELKERNKMKFYKKLIPTKRTDERVRTDPNQSQKRKQDEVSSDNEEVQVMEEAEAEESRAKELNLDWMENPALFQKIKVSTENTETAKAIAKLWDRSYLEFMVGMFSPPKLNTKGRSPRIAERTHRGAVTGALKLTENGVYLFCPYCLFGREVPENILQEKTKLWKAGDRHVVLGCRGISWEQPVWDALRWNKCWRDVYNHILDEHKNRRCMEIDLPNTVYDLTERKQLPDIFQIHEDQTDSQTWRLTRTNRRENKKPKTETGIVQEKNAEIEALRDENKGLKQSLEELKEKFADLEKSFKRYKERAG